MARVAPGIWDEKRLADLVPAVESSGQAVAMIRALIRKTQAAKEYATRREQRSGQRTDRGKCWERGIRDRKETGIISFFLLPTLHTTFITFPNV